MKYNVGDRVRVIARVNAAYMKEQPGLFVRFTEKMSKFKIVTITDVLAQEGIYLVNENPWEYTDEMLDGLVEEPEEKSEEPTDAELIQAAKMLLEHCNKRAVNDDCVGCPFDNPSSDGYCGLGAPCDDWHLPRPKTRKELLLEKFPDAEIPKDGVPVSCAKYLGLVSYCEQLDNGYCEACWNAPAESEEE